MHNVLVNVLVLAGLTVILGTVAILIPGLVPRREIRGTTREGRWIIWGPLLDRRGYERLPNGAEVVKKTKFPRLWELPKRSIEQFWVIGQREDVLLCSSLYRTYVSAVRWCKIEIIPVKSGSELPDLLRKVLAQGRVRVTRSLET